MESKPRRWETAMNAAPDNARPGERSPDPGRHRGELAMLRWFILASAIVATSLAIVKPGLGVGLGIGLSPVFVRAALRLQVPGHENGPTGLSRVAIVVLGSAGAMLLAGTAAVAAFWVTCIGAGVPLALMDRTGTGWNAVIAACGVGTASALVAGSYVLKKTWDFE